MKTRTTAILLFLFCTKVYSQTDISQVGKQSDAAWIRQLIENQNKQQAAAAKKDTLSQYVEWTSGRVVYSPDSCLRIAQLSGRFPYSKKINYITSVQFVSQHRALELKLTADTVNYTFRDYPISNIYKLPSPKGTYLIIATKTDTLPKAALHQADGTPITRPASQDSVYNQIGVVASVVHVVKDSIAEIGFETGGDNDRRPLSEIISGNSLSADLNTYLSATKDIPRPFIKYDPVKNELSFLTLYASEDDDGDNDGRGSSDPFLSVYSGVFKYKDSLFTLTRDSSYYYPSLKSFDKIIAVKNFSTGNYITKAKATSKYEEVGEGVLSVVQVDYAVQSQNLSYVDEINDNPVKPDIKPDFKVQKDGSLIFLITDSTTPNHGGACGGCEYFDSGFWLIKPNSKKLIFSFSSSSGNNYTTYTYNDGKSEKSGRFYLENKRQEDADKWKMSVDSTYWKDGSTYVFRVSDDTLARNFYVHFVTVNNKTIAKLTVSKLLRKKRKYAQ